MAVCGSFAGGNYAPSFAFNYSSSSNSFTCITADQGKFSCVPCRSAVKGGECTTDFNRPYSTTAVGCEFLESSAVNVRLTTTATNLTTVISWYDTSLSYLLFTNPTFAAHLGNKKPVWPFKKVRTCHKDTTAPVGTTRLETLSSLSLP